MVFNINKMYGTIDKTITYTLINNPQFKGEFKNDRYTNGKAIFTDGVIGTTIDTNIGTTIGTTISNKDIFPTTFITNTNTIGVTISKAAFFEIGISNNNKTISLSPLAGTSTNNINQEFNTDYKPSRANRRDEMMFDLPKVKLEDILVIKIIDNELCYSINNNNFIRLWCLDNTGVDNDDWYIYIYMSNATIKCFSPVL